MTSSEREAVPFETSERGFKHYEPIASTYGDAVRVYESSAAGAPHLWISLDTTRSTIRRDAPGDPAAHLSVEQAERLIATLQTALANHYQAPAPVSSEPAGGGGRALDIEAAKREMVRRTHGEQREGLARWPEEKRHVYEMAIEEACGELEHVIAAALPAASPAPAGDHDDGAHDAIALAYQSPAASSAMDIPATLHRLAEMGWSLVRRAPAPAGDGTPLAFVAPDPNCPNCGGTGEQRTTQVTFGAGDVISPCSCRLRLAPAAPADGDGLDEAAQRLVDATRGLLDPAAVAARLSPDTTRGGGDG